MKRILFMMLIAVPGYLFLGCEELSNPTAVSLSDQGGTSSLAKPPGTFSETRTFNVDAESQSPCEAQTIDIGGSLDAKFTYTLVGTSYELTLQQKPQDVVGVGLTTAVTYKGTGTSPSQFTGQVGVQETFQSSFPMKSQGPSANIAVQVEWLITINPDGSLASAIANIIGIECQ
jgi:hypothetical protein